MLTSLAVRRALRRWGVGAIAISPFALVCGCSLVVSVDGLTGGDSSGALEDTGAGPAIDAGAVTDGDAGASSRDGDAPFVDASFHDAPFVDAPSEAAADSGGDAPACTGDLSNIGAGDFHVAFALITTQNALAAILNQRDACNPAIFWDIRLNGANLRVEVDDNNGNFKSVTSSGVTLNDGQFHLVLVSRVGGTLAIQVDGINRGSVHSAAVLSGLPPLATGTDVCVGHDGTVPFTGSLSGVCVMRY